jgi:uncharacterized protein YbjT (DUF2867 family)
LSPPGAIVVTGATGTVGAEVLRLLRAAGQPVRAAVRDPGEARARLGPDVELVPFAFDVPRTHRDALHDARALFLMRPPPIADTRAFLPTLDAARAAGVGHVVFLSLQGVERNPAVPHHRIERLVRASGIPWTFLRPSFFMQNLSGVHREEIRLRHRVFVPAGRGRTAFIDARDVAAVAVQTLTEPGHERQAYELTGSEALDYAAVARILGEELGREIRYARPSAPAFWREMRRAGHPAAYAAVMTALYTAARLGLAAHLTDATRTLLERDPITFRQFARDHAHVWSDAPGDGAASGANATVTPAGARRGVITGPVLHWFRGQPYPRHRRRHPPAGPDPRPRGGDLGQRGRAGVPRAFRRRERERAGR